MGYRILKYIPVYPKIYPSIYKNLIEDKSVKIMPGEKSYLDKI